jgi:biotin carboxyl carrier protein
MKMENKILSPYSGIVREIFVHKGDVLQAGQVILTLGEVE